MPAPATKPSSGNDDDASDTQPDTDGLDAALPQRLTLLRTLLGLSAAEVDRSSGFRPGTLRRLERGEQRLYASHLFRIAQGLGVEIAWFYGDEDDALAGRSSEDLEMRRLIKVFLRINDDVLKRDIFELIEILAEKTSD